MDSKFGQVISELASDSTYTTFCEIGTWNGQGSTKCFLDGFSKRSGAILYSIEGDPAMHEIASKNLRNEPRVVLKYGTLHRDILTDTEVLSHKLFSKIDAHYRLWYPTELNTVKNAPLVSVPHCDVILLDGGEFSTCGDWNVLNHDKLRVVLLDDTQVIKTNELYTTLKTLETWKCTHDYPTDRNGWAVFVKNLNS